MDRNDPVIAHRLISPAPSAVPSLAEIEPHALRTWDGTPAPLATEVRIAHDGHRLVVAFRGEAGVPYRDRSDPTAPPDHPTPRMWEHDVVELFVSADGGRRYQEIEVSPIGQWLGLTFDGPRNLVPPSAPSPDGLVPAPVPEVAIDDGDAQTLHIRIAIPIAALRTQGLPAATGSPQWRIGLFRIAGPPPDRTHLSLLPAGDEAPDFHRPEAWAELSFA